MLLTISGEYATPVGVINAVISNESLPKFIITINARIIVDHSGDNEPSLSSCDATMAYRIAFSTPLAGERPGEREARKHRVPRRSSEFPRVSRNSLGVGGRGAKRSIIIP